MLGLVPTRGGKFSQNSGICRGLILDGLCLHHLALALSRFFTQEKLQSLGEKLPSALISYHVRYRPTQAEGREKCYVVRTYSH